MFVVTINNLWLKSYLSFIEWVADRMRCFYVLAMAINYLYCFFKKIIIKSYSTTFSILTSVFPLLYSTIQLTLSPISAPKNFITSLGIVVRADKLFGRATEILDSYSNTVISPIFVYSYIYIYTKDIYNYFHRIGRKIYILECSINN